MSIREWLGTCEYIRKIGGLHFFLLLIEFAFDFEMIWKKIMQYDQCHLLAPPKADTNKNISRYSWWKLLHKTLYFLCTCRLISMMYLKNFREI